MGCVPLTQRDVFVDTALTQVGKLDYGFDDRCGWTQGETDCSGLVSGSAQRSGVNVGPGCPNSAALALLCHNTPRPDWMVEEFGNDPWSTQGYGLTAEQARTTRGALKFHGPDEGIEGNGPEGHVGVSLGDGTSVEAYDHALDLIITSFIDPKNTYYAILPGMDGFAPILPKVPPMYQPYLEIAADLQNPQGGRWEARPNGTVRYITPKGLIVEGGMVSGYDRKQWGNRTVGQLKLRWYRPKGRLTKKAGYTIIATTGEVYVPQGQV